MALDQSDAPVAEANEIFGHFLSCSEIVDAHIEWIGELAAHRNGHHGRRRTRELGQNRNGFRKWRWKDYAVTSAVEKRCAALACSAPSSDSQSSITRWQPARVRHAKHRQGTD